MISITRIMAIVSRHMIPTFRDPMRIVNMLYWPSIDLILFGFISIWSREGMQHSDNFTLTFLVGVIFWMIIGRIAVEVGQSMLYDFRDNHIVNLFATPISIIELALSLLIVSIVQSLFTFSYNIIFIWFVFSKNVFYLLPILTPFFLLSILSGSIIGILTLSVIIYFGKKIEVFVWTTPWLFAIISGAYYSLDLFPKWLSTVAYSFPFVWIFDGIRIAINTNVMPLYHLLMAFILCLIYLFLTLSLLLYMFKRSKQNGLSSLE